MRERRRLNYEIDNIKENKEYFTLIWLDEEINEYSDRLLNELEQFHDCVLVYTNPQLCIEYIQSVKNEKIFLIIASENLIHEVVPTISSMSTVDSLYLFQQNRDITFTYTPYPSFIHIVNSQNLLNESINTRIHQISKQDITFTLFDTHEKATRFDLALRPASYLWFQMLFGILKQLPQTIEAKEQMIELCKTYYQVTNNRVELANVEHFRTHYSPNEAIN